MTLWSPDTCGCSVEYTDDDKFTFIRSHQACTRHSSDQGTPAHLSKVLAENQNKNKALAAIQAAIPNVGVRWALDQDTGALTISASSLPSASVLNAIKAQFPGVTFILDPTILPGEI